MHAAWKEDGALKGEKCHIHTYIHICIYINHKNGDQFFTYCGISRVLCQVNISFPSGSAVKNPPAMQELQEAGSAPGSGRSPGRGHGHALQYSCLENPMDRGPYGLQSIASQTVGHN